MFPVRTFALAAAFLPFLFQAHAASPSAREKRLKTVQKVRTQSRPAVFSRVSVPTLDPGSLAALGELLYTDTNLSLLGNQSCETCHRLTPAVTAAGLKEPAEGFVDDDNITHGTPVSDGSVPGKSGSLNAPSVGYSAFSPQFHWDSVEGLYVGGQFWNGRAANLAEQAAQPFLNPNEMAMPSKWAVVSRLRENPQYRVGFAKHFNIDLNEVPSFEQAPATIQPPAAVFAAYDALTKAIAEFEKSPRFNRFTSKFDFVLAGVTNFTAQEALGEELFNGRAGCNGCHVTDATIAPDGSPMPPLFTDFTYDNIGLPRNLKIPGNPTPDPGLGGRPDIAGRDPASADLGKHKVMSLRNIAITPPYGHNGVFETLEQITHFYNTRDILGRVPDNTSPGFGVSGWPAPEVPENENMEELGNLGLTLDEEAAVVAFMRTLTDGYPDWGNDPNVPPGTPSPFAHMPFPPIP